MTAPEIMAYAVVAASCLTLWAWGWNWTTLALVGSFFAGHLWWVLTGECPLSVAILCDYAVMASILLKVEAIDCSPIGGFWRQMKPCWTELSPYDKIVLLLFAPAWIAYAVGLDDVLRYWILWGAGIAQFAVAGAESFSLWRRRRAEKADDAHSAEPFLRWRLVGNEC